MSEGRALLRARQFFEPRQRSADGRSERSTYSRDREAAYRRRRQHDRVVRSTHGVNCTGSCSWRIHVKDGLVTWETQQTDYPSNGPEMPDYEPRGCPRGASFSWYVYSPLRPKHPYLRGVLLEMYREARGRLGDPVEAWASILGEAGEGRWNLDLEGIEPELTLLGRHDAAVEVTLPRFDGGETEGGTTMRRGVPAMRIGNAVLTTVFDLALAQYGVEREGLPGEWPSGYDDASQPHTPAWQEPLTGVDAGRCARIAREFAENAERTGLLAVGIATGLLATLTNLGDVVDYRETVAPYFRQVLVLDPKPGLMTGDGISLIFQVHAWSVPVDYLRRSSIPYRGRAPRPSATALRSQEVD